MMYTVTRNGRLRGEHSRSQTLSYMVLQQETEVNYPGPWHGILPLCEGAECIFKIPLE